MHLIIFPLLILFVLGTPVLLLWPRKGLSLTNYGRLIVGASFGVFVGLLMILLLNGMELNQMLLLMGSFVVLPMLFSAFLVKKSRSVGYYISDPRALLFNAPLAVAKAYLIANIVGLGLSYLVLYAVSGPTLADFVVLMSFVKLPVSLIITIVATCFVVRPSHRLAIWFSVGFGLASSLFLYSGKIIASAVITYAFVTPYILIRLLERFSRVTPSGLSQPPEENFSNV